MGSKTVAVAIILVVVVVLFFVDTRLLLEPILDRFSLREPEATYTPVLKVDGYVDEANSTERVYAIAYSVLNTGNTTAQNVTLAAVVDGETHETKLIQSLSASDSCNYSLVVPSASDELHVVSLQASCEDSVDAYSFAFGADVGCAAEIE